MLFGLITDKEKIIVKCHYKVPVFWQVMDKYIMCNAYGCMCVSLHICLHNLTYLYFSPKIAHSAYAICWICTQL